MENSKQIYLVKSADLMKATLYEGGCLAYTPMGGIAHLIQKKADEDLGKLDFILVHNYGNFYKECLTDLPIAKGKKMNVPVYINDSATLASVTPTKALKFAKKSKNYVTNFYKTYASGLNAIYEHQAKESGYQKRLK